MKDILTFNNFLFVYQSNDDMSSNFDDFQPLQKINTHTIQVVEKIILLSKHYLTQQLRSKLYKTELPSEWAEITRTINTIDQSNLISKIKFVKSLKEHILNSYN